MYVKNALSLSAIVLFLTFQTPYSAGSEQETASNSTATSDNQKGAFKNASAADIAWRDKYLPLAIEWAQQLLNSNSEKGRALTASEIEAAKRVGVLYPENVRIIRLDRIPLPEKGQLAEVMIPFGITPENVRGLTIDNLIFIDTDLSAMRDGFPTIVQHELVHVAQYEQMGIKAFLSDYFLALRVMGPIGIPLEIEAYKKQSI